MLRPHSLRHALPIFLGIVFAATAAAADPAGIPGVFADTDVAAKIGGRKQVTLPLEGVTAWPDAEGGPAWYLDAVGRIAGTREGWFRLADSRLQPLGKADVRRFHADIARRLALPARYQWISGDGKAEGKRELVLLTAYDCEGCSWLQQELIDHAAQLKVRIHYVIGTLAPHDPDSRRMVRAITCAPDPVRSYQTLDGDEDTALPKPAKDCAGQDDTFGYVTTLLGARYSPWLVDKNSGDVIAFGSLESDTLVRVLNGTH